MEKEIIKLESVGNFISKRSGRIFPITDDMNMSEGGMRFDQCDNEDFVNDMSDEDFRKFVDYYIHPSIQNRLVDNLELAD